MIHKLPIIGWLFGIVAAISLAIPFWVCWSACGIGTTFAPWLPAQYQSPGFWQCVGLFICASIIKAVLVPRFATVSQTNKD